jgi:hypothetical protein
MGKREARERALEGYVCAGHDDVARVLPRVLGSAGVLHVENFHQGVRHPGRRASFLQGPLGL